MRITDVTIDEFAYRFEDVATEGGRLTYSPGSQAEQPGFVLTIRTADGTEGQYRGGMIVQPMITQIEMAARSYLVGRDPLERERIWQDVWRAHRHTDHFGLGPIDVALWDLAGRHYGESVSALLGGYRESIPAYASTYFGNEDDAGGLDGPDAYAAFAETCAADGYPGFKIHPIGEAALDVDIVHAVGDAVGDDLDLMLDPADAYGTYADALRVGRALDEEGFLWYEDPMTGSGESLHLARRLKDRLDTPLLGGEHARSGPIGTANALATDVFEYVRADVHLDGGITGAMKIAAIAEGFGVDVEFHGGGPATVHCLSAIRNTNYFEHALLHPQFEEKNAQGLTADVDRPDPDGRVRVPTGPGLGVDIDREFLAERRTARTVIDEDGVHDE